MSLRTRVSQNRMLKVTTEVITHNTEGHHCRYFKRERKDQLDQIPPPLYTEYYPDEKPLDTPEMQGNLYSSFSKEEHENMAHHEICHDREEKINEEE